MFKAAVVTVALLDGAGAAGVVGVGVLGAAGLTDEVVK